MLRRFAEPVNVNVHVIYKLYALLLHKADATVDNALVEFEVWYAIAQQTACGFVFLEDGDAIAFQVQSISSSQAGRTGSYDSHLLTIAFDVRTRLDIPLTKSTLRDGTLIFAVGSRLVIETVQHTSLLTECRADASRKLREWILMGMLYGAQVQTMMPKLHSTNFEGMELIRPLYLVRQDDIIAWKDYNQLRFLQCACHFTERNANYNPDDIVESKRIETRRLIAQLKKVNPYVESNIFKSVENVNLATVIAYKKDGVRHHFLDTYDEM